MTHMKRRDFLQRSLVTGPALAAGGSLLSACQGHSNQVQAQLPPPYHFGLAEVSIDELQRRRINAKSLTRWLRTVIKDMA